MPIKTTKLGDDAIYSEITVFVLFRGLWHDSRSHVFFPKPLELPQELRTDGVARFFDSSFKRLGRNEMGPKGGRRAPREVASDLNERTLLALLGYRMG